MKKTVILATILVIGISFAGISHAQTNNLITHNSAGKVKLGMSVAEARKALAGLKLERSSDGEGVALIAVERGKDVIMTIYSGEEDRDAPIDENSIVQFIEVWSKDFQTTGGARVGMKINELENKYGKLRKITVSEIEHREFGEFANQPAGIQFRLLADGSDAGDYPQYQNTTTKHSPGAYLFSFQVVGVSHFSDDFKPDQNAYFSSSYTSLSDGCDSTGGEEGGHVSTICKGFGAYRINYFDSAANLNFGVELYNGENRINLASQLLSYDTKNRKVEWRLANAEAFALIMRINKFKTADDGIPGKITGEYLIVKGLNKFEHINFVVDANKPNANQKARDLADSAYKQEPDTAKRIKFHPNSQTVQAKGAFSKSGETVEFVVNAEKDQNMIVKIIPVSEGLATTGVVTLPSGEVDGQPGGFVFNSLLKASGDYKIRVGQRPTDHSFPAEFIVEIILLPNFIVADIVSSENAATFQTISISEFNQKIESAVTSEENWVKMPTKVIGQILPEFSEARSRDIEMLSESAESSDSMVVFVTDDGFLDDSVRGAKYKFELKENAEGVWKVVSAGKAQRCWQGRGHQDYSPAPCI